MDNFERIFDKLDIIEKNSKETCIHLARVEEQVISLDKKMETHIANKIRETDMKYKKYAVIFAIIASASAIVNIIGIAT